MAVPTEAGSQLDKEATDAAYANTIQLEDDESGNSGEEDSEQEVQVADLRSLRSSRSSSSSESSSVDDIEQDLARLDQLRQNVKHNLKLRPIRSTSTLRNEIVSAQSPISPTPSSTTSAYFTPLDEQPPGGNRFLAAPASSPPLIMAHPPKTPFSPFTPGLASTPHTPYTPPVYTSTLHTPRPISAGELAIILSSSTSFPLLIDTRPLATHNLFHIRHSVPIAIPSLILKRSRKPNLKGSQFTTMRSLKQFITTEHGRKIFEAFLEDGTAMGTENGLWNGDVIIYDEDMDVKDRGNSSSTPWALLGVVQSLLDSNANSANPKASSVDTRTILDSFPSEPEPQIGKADYIEGGIGHTRYHPNPQLQMLIVGAGEDGENELGTVSVTQDLSTASNPNLKASSLFASASALAPPRSESPVPLGPSAKRKGPPPSLGLGGGLFQLDTHQAMYKTRGEVLIDQSLNSASTLASANASANSLKTVDSDMTVTQMSLNSTASLSSISDSPSEEQHVLSSVDLKSVNPSPLPMMPSFTISSTVVPSSTAPQHLLPPTHLHLALSEPNPASATLSSGISDSGFKTAFTSLADPSPSPPPSASQIGFSLGKADASATVGGGFKRPPPPSQMNKRPSAPDLRIGIGKEGTSTSIPPNPVVFPNPVPGAGATPPVKRLPKLSLNTGGVGGLGVGGERGTWGTGVGGSLGRRMGTKLRSATVGGGTGSWNRDSHFQQPPLPLSFNLNQNSKISAEPDSTSVAVANAFSPTSNIKNPFQSLTLPLPSSSNPSHSSDSNLPGFGLHPPSPSHLNLAHSHHHRHTPSPPGSARLYGSFTSEGAVEGNVNAPPRPPPSPGFGKTSFGFGEGTTDGREWPGRKLSAPAISLSRSFSTRGPGLPSRDLAPLVPPKRVPSPSWTVSSEAEHDLDTESESETTSTESRTSISSLSTSSSSLESFSEIDEGPGTVNGGSKSDEMVEFPAYQLRVDRKFSSVGYFFYSTPTLRSYRFNSKQCPSPHLCSCAE
ncbi:hypothetical protein BDP27DRAFT_144861 [Rhodocollybia butyracea]|uniref:Rhodanese domain-containing protein n=1 Tax=Rhodocollybia butyracea TaxID=206335 RepID=A0A9P5Q5E9_9AGAR|nr:hypothetical protein BDP27DRAFT_144861 [Rhodocollybia butyracea]